MMRIFLTLTFTAITLFGQAQFSAKPDDLNAMSKLTLVVEVPDINPVVLEAISKRKKGAEEEAAYRTSVSTYQSHIQDAVGKYWTFNKEIEYKTAEEIKKLFESNSSKYVVLMKGVISPNFGLLAHTWTDGFPVLVFTRTNSGVKSGKTGSLTFQKPDFYMNVACTVGEERAETYSEADIKFTVIQLQKTLNTNMADKKTREFVKIASEEADVNCPKLAAKQLLVNKDELYKNLSASEAQATYGPNLQLVDQATIDRAYLDGDADKAVIFTVPVSFGMYSKLVVDPSNNEILATIVPKALAATYVKTIAKLDLEQFKKCK